MPLIANTFIVEHRSQAGLLLLRTCHRQTDYTKQDKGNGGSFPDRVPGAIADCEGCSAIIPVMSILDALKTTLTLLVAHLTASSKSPVKSSLNPREVYFTNNFIKKAKQRGLAEKDALDVYYHGQDRKDNMRCRTYNGYELCIYYGHNSRTGQPYIATIWKRERR